MAWVNQVLVVEEAAALQLKEKEVDTTALPPVHGLHHDRGGKTNMATPPRCM